MDAMAHIAQFPIHNYPNFNVLITKIVLILADNMSEIPPLYYIFASWNAGSPDLHIVGGQTLYVFGSSTYGECLCFGPIRFHSLCGSNESKTLLFFDSHLNSLCCCSFTYFCKCMKIFLGAQKYHHFEFLSFFNVLLFPIH